LNNGRKEERKDIKEETKKGRKMDGKVETERRTDRWDGGPKQLVPLHRNGLCNNNGA
jgi:hypothetical protein